MNSKNKYKSFENYIPIIGILIFVIFYIYSTTLYPGGSQANLHSVGFDWKHNYWCNLMRKKAINGAENPARFYAIISLICLCISLIVFFYQFSIFFVKETCWQKLIQISSTISLSMAMFVFTEYHDILTIFSSIFGVILLIGLMRSILTNNMYIFKYTAILILIILLINNYIYYSKYFIEYLPTLQKITKLLIILWIITLQLKLIIFNGHYKG